MGRGRKQNFNFEARLWVGVVNSLVRFPVSFLVSNVRIAKVSKDSKEDEHE